MRRATISGRQAIGCQPPCSVIHSSTSARALARVIAEFGRAQMAQPAEAEQRVGPFLRRRRHLERRAAVADHDLAGEGEPAGIDFARAGRIGGAQVLRRDHQPVGLAGQERPAATADGRRDARRHLSKPAPQRQATDSLRRSAIDTRDIDAAPFSSAANAGPAGHVAQHSEAVGRAANRTLKQPVQVRSSRAA